jgi:hypothetical protein
MALGKVPQCLRGETLQMIVNKSKSGIRELIEYVTGVRIHAKFPNACLSKQVLSLALRQMHKLFDVKISQEWLSIVLDTSSGELRWYIPGAGASKYIVDDTECVPHVEHCSGMRAAVPLEIRLSVDWAISSNFSHTDVETKYGLLNFKFVNSCDELQPIRETCKYDTFKGIAERIQGEMEQKTEVLTEGKIECKPEIADRKREGPPTSPPGTKMMAIADGCAE